MFLGGPRAHGAARSPGGEPAEFGADYTESVQCDRLFIGPVPIAVAQYVPLPLPGQYYCLNHIVNKYIKSMLSLFEFQFFDIFPLPFYPHHLKLD